MSSNIPEARAKLQYVLDEWNLLTDRQKRKILMNAFAQMTRAPAIIKSNRSAPVKITKNIRRNVRNLARNGLNNHDIAERVGLGNGGRVSEILNGKR